MGSVRAFQPRKYDPPKFVAETGDDLADMEGDFIGAGQCDGCGNATYQIQVRMSDGSVKTLTYGTAPAWKAGDRVRLQNGRLVG